MRLTNQWTKTSAEAFGKTGEAGDIGEDWIHTLLKENNLDVKAFPSDKKKQISGIDIELNGIGIDIKSNLTDLDTFYVEVKSTGWLLNECKTSEIIWHVNPRSGTTFWYKREDMVAYVKSNKPKFELLKIRNPRELNFINEVQFNEKTKVYMGNLPERGNTQVS
jgi:hypothetical protein